MSTEKKLSPELLYLDERTKSIAGLMVTWYLRTAIRHALESRCNSADTFVHALINECDEKCRSKYFNEQKIEHLRSMYKDALGFIDLDESAQSSPQELNTRLRKIAQTDSVAYYLARTLLLLRESNQSLLTCKRNLDSAISKATPTDTFELCRKHTTLPPRLEKTISKADKDTRRLHDELTGLRNKVSSLIETQQ